MYWAYVIESTTTGRRYVGHTGDLERRIREHNDPEHSPVKYTTRHVGPWKLVYCESHETRAKAMRRERWLKSGKGRDWLKQLNR